MIKVDESSKNIAAALANHQTVFSDSASWDFLESKIAYRCEIRVFQEGGLYCSYVSELAGVVSQGQTEIEARNNAEEALRGAIAEYHQMGQEIPWKQPEKKTHRLEHEKSFWVVISG